MHFLNLDFGGVDFLHSGARLLMNATKPFSCNSFPFLTFRLTKAVNKIRNFNENTPNKKVIVTAPV